jgi:hypothetical protein
VTDAPDVADSDLEWLRQNAIGSYFTHGTLARCVRIVGSLAIMARDIRQEIAVLRATPSAEVEQLRKELRGFNLRV